MSTETPNPTANTSTHSRKKVDVKEYTIRPANTNQLEQHQRTAHTNWARGRTWEKFLAEDGEERQMPWAVDGRKMVWVLVKWDDLEGDMYAGCETYRSDGLVKRQASTSIDSTTIYGIASVVTPIHHHRNGYATHLLRLLHYILAEPNLLPPFPDTWGPPPPLQFIKAEKLPKAIGSILWSDVGSKFYEKCTIGTERPGWVVKDYQNSEIVWDVLKEESDGSGSGDVNGQENEWEFVYGDDLPEITDILAEAAKQRLITSKGDRTVFTQNPKSNGILSFVSNYGTIPTHSPTEVSTSKPKPLGIRLKTNHQTLALFTINNSIGPRFLITAINNILPSHLSSLLPIFDRMAREGGKDRCWIWGVDVDGELASGFRDLEGRRVVVGRRPEVLGHLLGVAWYGPPEERGELLNCQMWSWC